MDIFSVNPKSFKLHQKSPLASRLKSSISANLPQFLADYRDDVLAEYVTVLVCNGKHQYQAKEDLEAFLGNRTVEFVSWLWNTILEYSGQSSTDTGLLYLDEVAAVIPQDGDRCKDTSNERCAELQSHSTWNAGELLMKDDKTYPVLTRDRVSSEDKKLAKGSQHCTSFSAPFSEVSTKKALSRTCRNEILRSTVATEYINHEILNQESSGLPKELLHLPKSEAESNFTQSTISERPCPKQIRPSNNLGSSLSPRFVGTGSVDGKRQVSVWDRLGKPCEDTYIGHKNVDSYHVGHEKQDGEVHNQLPLIPLKRNPEVPALGKRSYSHLVETWKLEHGDSTVVEPHTANNIGRKRLFGEVSADPVTSSVSLVHERNMNPQCKDIKQDFKKSNLTKSGLKTSQNLVSEVLDVKQRLHQIEMEMSKLQSKQVEMKNKDGTINHLSNSGILKNSEKNFEMESRTVFVTNVHFAATKEALSLFFSKCGMVVNVVMLIDILTAKQNGCAYVTFASKESVEKALALSGSTFYSRTIKVLRMAEAAFVASAPTQLSAKTFHTRVPHCKMKAIPNKPRYLRSSLQWRRESSTGQSETSAPASVEGVSSSAPKLLSASDKERNTSSTEPRAPCN